MVPVFAAIVEISYIGQINSNRNTLLYTNKPSNH